MTIDRKAIEERAAEWEERRDAATAGDWWVLEQDQKEREVYGSINILIGDQEDRVCEIHVGECAGKEDANAAFIAHARSYDAKADIDALLARVRELEQALSESERREGK